MKVEMYKCKVCGRMFDTEKECDECEGSHNVKRLTLFLNLQYGQCFFKEEDNLTGAFDGTVTQVDDYNEDEGFFQSWDVLVPMDADEEQMNHWKFVLKQRTYEWLMSMANMVKETED